MAKEKKPLYKRWYMIVLYVFLGFIILGSILPENQSSNNGLTQESKDSQQSLQTSVQTTKSNDQAEVQPESKTTEQKTFNLGDSVDVGSFKWKITKFEKASQIGQNLMGTFMGVKANGEYLIQNVEVENVGKSAQVLMDSFVKLINDQGREFSPDTAAAFYLEPQGSALMFETINPGIVKKGKIVYDVPKGLKVVDVRISNSLLESSFYTIKMIS